MGKLKKLKKLEKLKPYALQIDIQPKRLLAITSELAKVQYLKDKAEDWEKAEKAKKSAKNGKRLRIYTIVAFSFIRTFAP